MRGRVALLLAVFAVPRPEAAAEPADVTAELVARSFFGGLLSGQTASLVPLCAREVSFDGEWVRDETALRAKLEQMSTRARQRGLRLKLVQVMPVDEAVRRYGPPPRRLRPSLARASRVALARFNVRGAVALLRLESGFWRLIAITD